MGGARFSLPSERSSDGGTDWLVVGVRMSAKVGQALSSCAAEQSALSVGQDGILRAGWQPAPAGLFPRGSGGLPTRRRLPTCPTTSARIPVRGKTKWHWAGPPAPPTWLSYEPMMLEGWRTGRGRVKQCERKPSRRHV